MSGFGQGVIIKDDITGKNASVDTQGALKVNVGTVPTFAYESITADNTVKSLSSVYTDNEGTIATRAIITIETAQIRWRMDGGNPSSSEGHLSNPIDSIILSNTSDITNFKFTRVSATNAILRVSYAG